MITTVVTTITTTIDTTGQQEVTHEMEVASDALPENLVVAAALSACRAGVTAMEERSGAQKGENDGR